LVALRLTARAACGSVAAFSRTACPVMSLRACDQVASVFASPFTSADASPQAAQSYVLEETAGACLSDGPCLGSATVFLRSLLALSSFGVVLKNFMPASDHKPPRLPTKPRHG
jgi:hypothetical protein